MLANDGALVQVLINLIGNARDACLDAGAPEVVVQTRFVSGMEPYVTTREKGTGLGLAIVKKIVEEHGGELNFAPGPDGGTSATLRFARDPAAIVGSEAAE